MSGPICSQCGYVMKLMGIREAGPADPADTSGTGAWYFAGAHFDCTHCEQNAHVRPDGSGTMTLVNIHPPPRTARDHHEYVDYWQAEKMMFLGMRCAAHYITREEYDTTAKEIEDKVVEYKAEHPLPRSLWARVITRLRPPEIRAPSSESEASAEGNDAVPGAEE